MFFNTWLTYGYDFFSYVFFGMSYGTLSDPGNYYASFFSDAHAIQLVVWCTHLSEFAILCFVIYSAFSLTNKMFRRII